jgi:cytochrome bd-type quinol oxidase subunit 1
MIALDLFALSFSSVYLILMGAFAGLMLTIIQRMQGKNNADKEENK